MRFAFLAAVAALSCAASASFELVMALDSDNHTVHRIDGERNIYLGNFGANRLVNPSAMAIQQSANKAHVYDPYLRSVVSFDYNTGEKVGEAAMPSYGYATLGLANNGDFLVGDFFSASARRYSQGGILSAIFTAPAGSTGTRAMMQAPDGNYYVAWAGSNVITRHNASGTLLATVTSASTSIADSRQMFIQNSQVVISGGNSGKYVRMTYSNTTSWGPMIETSVNTYAYGVSAGHFSTIYASGYSTLNSASVYSYSLTTGYQTSSYTVPGAGTIVALGTVVAPEPQTITGMLAAGLVGLMARRKRRAK